MLKKLLVILIVSLSIIVFSNIAWSSVQGTWEITGKVTTTVKGKGIKTTIITGRLDGDSWIFNSDNSFDSDNVGGTWSQTKTKFTVNFNDEDVISLAEEMLSEEFGTDITVNAITKKTFSGTENTRKGTIKGSFKIYMTASGYDEDCGCERTGKVTVAGSFNGTVADPSGNNISDGTFKGSDPNIELDVLNNKITRVMITFRGGNSTPVGCISGGIGTSNPAGLASINNGIFNISFNDFSDGTITVSGSFTDNNYAGGIWNLSKTGCTNNDSWTATRQ